MLYDPKWDVQADPYSPDNFITWLEKQESSETYQVFFPRSCLLGQFANDMGAIHPGVVSNRLLCVSLFNSTVLPEPHTFGAALERARGLV